MSVLCVSSGSVGNCGLCSGVRFRSVGNVSVCVVC